jgi:hypothetical protein
MISRRSFFSRVVQGIGLSFILPSSLQSCKDPHIITGKILGPNAALGHRLRTMDFPVVTETTQVDILIVGGGVAGLSAARYLKKHTDNFVLVELEEHAGGNAMAGSNDVSAFPWGAHYLPLPGSNDSELTEFLKDASVITGTENGLPVFNEYFLCHDPKERLFINHYWQDSLIPHEGVPKNDREEIEHFLQLMFDYKKMKGSDGKDAFTIPLEYCSKDKEILALDTLTADQFLANHNFKSPYLRWYVNYCCADDYGSGLEETSAWAMVHYFASRKGVAANASSDSVLTWPEGNYWLIQHLKKTFEDKIQSKTIVYKVEHNDSGVEVLCYDAEKNISKKILCRKVIMATPQFINQRIVTNKREIDYAHFQYAPWMVANLTVKSTFGERRGEQLCWDNVIYGSDSLGYVNAMHQQVQIQGNEKVITYYKPLLGSNVSQLRKSAYEKTYDNWRTLIINDLKIPHPEIEKNVREMNLWIWGHGMIKPSKEFIWSANRVNAFTPIDDKIYFAHADLSGISIFEEAFYQGHKSAKALLGHNL